MGGGGEEPFLSGGNPPVGCVGGGDNIREDCTGILLCPLLPVKVACNKRYRRELLSTLILKDIPISYIILCAPFIYIHS
jgi:hypothetical protein